MARTRRAVPDGLVNVVMEGDGEQVFDMLMKLNSQLDPSAMAVFMQGTIDPYIRTRAKGRFASEGDDVSGKWEPLKPSTQAIRARQQLGPAHPINIRTHEMENFLTGKPGQALPNPLGATYTWPAEQPMGELEKKLMTAQKGRVVPPTNPRPVIGINERDLLAVLTDLSLYLAVGQFR